jgi:tetratricopeptide (TPR) repeat protein
MQAENKTGSDYKVITTLLKTKDFNEAYKIAKITLTWPREVPDPLEGSSAIMHCQNYRDTRPEAMGGLAHAFIGNGALDKGYEIATLIRTYWENKSFGQKSFCYSEAAKGSYLTTMSDLIKGYAAKGEKQKARQMYVEAKSVLQVQTDTIHRYSKSDFEALARTAAANGLSDGFDDLAKFVSVHSEVDYPAIYASYNSDPAPLIYAQAGEYQKAIDLIEASTYANTKPMTKMEEIVGRDSASTEDVRLTTYLSIAKSLATKGDNKGAMLFLDKATPYLGKRKPKYDPAVENLTDYITKANILLDIGEREKSKDVLGELLGLFNATNKNDYRGGSITNSLYYMPGMPPLMLYRLGPTSCRHSISVPIMRALRNC